MKPFRNPFRPSAGHPPPHLAGRQKQISEFVGLLDQDPIMTNLILTGLRGVGKTVLLEKLKPIALEHHWGWVGSDLSESASISEENMAIRILTDLAVWTSMITVPEKGKGAGFTTQNRRAKVPLSYMALFERFSETPGLIADKLKHVLEYVWSVLPKDGEGIIFAYDEAQNLADQAAKDQYPLSMLLDIFQSIERKEVRFLLVLAGLPTLQPKLVEARTYTERMFHVVTLGQLSREESKEAIMKPIQREGCPVSFDTKSVETIIDVTAGYPYFIQFICKEVYDIWIRAATAGRPTPKIPIVELTKKLDSDFFAGRWAKATDRQRDMLKVIATLPNCDEEFTVQEIVAASHTAIEKPFSPSHVNQLLSALTNAGLVFRNRFGKYSFAVPLMGQFIRRQAEQKDITA